ncbi:MAG: hypothetical protein ACJ8FS_11880 [Sphingomicrobium sp.]
MIAVALLAASALTFNLVCVGNEDHDAKMTQLLPPGRQMQSATIPFRETYRINLEQRRWCRDTCARTEALVSVTRSDIIIEDNRSGEMRFSTVGRETGKYSSSFYLPNFVKVFQYGSCKREPFTGFPRQKF